MLRRILDFFWSPCPSGLPHRTRWGVVTNVFGKQYCWHRDCMKANLAECYVPDPLERIDERLARLEREHFGDIDKGTGIYAPRTAGVPASDHQPFDKKDTDVS